MLDNLRTRRIDLTKHLLSIINKEDKRELANKLSKLNREVDSIINNKRRTLLIETNLA
jgi:hypothetical protein